jgi:spermidine/putrescine-binding protein
MSEQNEDLDFYYPVEGTNYFVDAMCIPKNANLPEVAKEYINFMLSEEVAIANALYIGYASPNKLVFDGENYNEEYAEEMGEYALDILYGKSPDEVNAKYLENYQTACYRSFNEEEYAAVNTLWESLKTENSTEIWVHIFAVTIVGAVITLAVYTTYTRKKRSRDYRLRDKMAKMAKKEK